MELLRVFGGLLDAQVDTLQNFGTVFWAQGGKIKTLAVVQRDLRVAFTRVFRVNAKELDLELWLANDQPQETLDGMPRRYLDALKDLYLAGDGIVFYCTGEVCVPVFALPSRLGEGKSARAHDHEGYRVVLVRIALD